MLSEPAAPPSDLRPPAPPPSPLVRPAMSLASRLPRTIPFHVAIALLFATSGIMWGVWIARIPGVSANLDLNRAELGLVLPAFSIGALIAFPVSATINSRFGSRVAIRVFGVLRGLAFPLL